MERQFHHYTQLWLDDMTSRSLYLTLALAMVAVLLGGCVPISLTQLTTVLAVQLGGVLCAAYLVYLATKDQRLQITISVIAAIALSASVIFLPLQKYGHSKQAIRRLFGELFFGLGTFLAGLIFGIIFGLGGIFAVLIVYITPSIPRIGLYLFFISPPLLSIFLYFLLRDTRGKLIKLDSGLIETLLLGTLVGLFFGSFLAAGFLTGSVLIPLVILLVGTCCVTYLAYVAWTTTRLREKLGIYTVVFLLAYELWLLLERCIDSWDAAVLTVGKLNQ